MITTYEYKGYKVLVDHEKHCAEIEKPDERFYMRVFTPAELDSSPEDTKRYEAWLIQIIDMISP